MRRTGGRNDVMLGVLNGTVTMLGKNEGRKEDTVCIADKGRQGRRGEKETHGMSMP